MADVAVPAEAMAPTLPSDLQRHLDGCAPCREEVRRDRTALATLRAAAEAAATELEESGNGALSPARRRLVLDRVTARPALGWGLLPVLDWRPALAVATAAVVMVAVGIGVRVSAPGSEQASSAAVSAGLGTDLQVVAEGHAVTLRWTDGRDEHRVIRSTDPRHLSRGRVEVVRGDQWVDPETNGARMVFYVVD